MPAWNSGQAAVRRVIERYRDAEILVAGHGKPGGVELLSHTMELLETGGADRLPGATGRQSLP